MDDKMEKYRPYVHISVKTYLSYISQGILPPKLLTRRPFEDFIENGQKYFVDLEPADHSFVFPEGNFDQMISSNPVYIKKLMNRLSNAIKHFTDLLNNEVKGDFALFDENRLRMQQAYLFKVINSSDHPSSLYHNYQKIIFFKEFSYQVAQAFLAGRKPEDFKQFASTRPKNLNRMRSMHEHLSLGCISKRQLYTKFIENEEYIQAHSLTLLPEADLKLQLLTSLLTTYNDAVSKLISTPRERISYFDFQLVGGLLGQYDCMQPIELSTNLTIDDVLRLSANLLNDLDNSLKTKQTREVITIFRNNPFYSKIMEEKVLPESLASKIQDYLEQNHPFDFSSRRLRS